MNCLPCSMGALSTRTRQNVSRANMLDRFAGSAQDEQKSPALLGRTELRKLFNAPDYSSCIREERNLVAIIYHLLLTLSEEELQSFLSSIGVDPAAYPVDWDREGNSGFGIYYDYSYLRDLWRSIGSQNSKEGENGSQDQIRRNVVMKLMTEETWMALGLDEVANSHQFNLIFNPSVKEKSESTRIHSPSSWRIGPRDKIRLEHVVELEIIKKAFNAKPDLVIHTSSDRAVCFEFKCEAGASIEGGYHQLGIQKRIFEMLGIQSKMYYVTPSGIPTPRRKQDNPTHLGPKLSIPDDVTSISWKSLVSELLKFEKCRQTLQREFVKNMFKVARADDCIPRID